MQCLLMSHLANHLAKVQRKQWIKNLGAQLLVTHPRGFHQKYQSRELFHKRSKHSMYRRMLRKNQTLEAKCQEKDMLLESPDNTIEAFVTNQESRCPTLGDTPKGFSSKISEQRAISQKIKRQNVSQNAQEKSNSASKLPWKRPVVGESRQQDWSSRSKMPCKRCAVQKSKERNWALAMANSRTTSSTKNVKQRPLCWRQQDWSSCNESRI